MATITATSTNNWASAFPSTPTAADDVVIPSGFTVTIPSATTVVGRSINVQNGGGLTFAATTSTLTLGDSVAGTGNAAITVGATATITLTGIGTINLVSTSTTVQTITTNGKTLPAVTINGAGSRYQFADALTSTGAWTLTTGELNTNAKTVSWSTFSSTGTGTRVLTITSSTITCTSTSGTAWGLSGSNMTFTATGSTINIKSNFTGASGYTYATLVWDLQGSAASYTFAPSSCTFTNLTLQGIAARNIGLKITTDCTVTGNLTFTGNSTVNRADFKSTVGGTARTFTVTGAAITKTNVIFKDITFSGTPASQTDSLVGDAGGNTGITFTTPASQTWSGTSGGLWSANAWTTRVPLPQDDVTISSAFSASQTITMDMTYLGKNVSFSGSTGNPALAGSVNVTAEIQGSFNMTGLGSTTSASGNALVLGGRSTYTFTTNGVSLTIPLTIDAPGGSYTLTGNYNQRVNNFTVTNGYFYSANYTIDVGTTGNSSSFNVSSSTLAGCVLGTSTVNINSTGAGTTFTVVSVAAAAYFDANTATFNIKGYCPVLRTVNIAGQRIGTLNFTELSPGGLGISGSNFFHNLNVGSNTVFQLQSSTTQTIKNLSLQGANNGYLRLPGVTGSYASAPDSAALSITGDITLEAKIAFDDWTPAAEGPIVTKYGSIGQRGWFFSLLASGKLRMEWSSDGTADIAKDSTVATGFADGSTNWVRATLDVNNGAGGNDVRFYTSSDGSTWTQLGTTITTAGTTANFDNTTALAIGTYIGSTSVVAIAKVYEVKVYNSDLGSGSGTPVFHANFATKTFGADTFTESSANAATVTINGDAAQAGDGRILVKASSAGTSAFITSPMSWFVGANSVDKGNNSSIYYSAGGTQLGDYCTFKDFNGRNRGAAHQLNTLGVG